MVLFMTRLVFERLLSVFHTDAKASTPKNAKKFHYPTTVSQKWSKSEIKGHDGILGAIHQNQSMSVMACTYRQTTLKKG